MSNVYFIYGDDEYAIQKQINTIVAKIDASYDEIKLDMDDNNIGNLIEELRTIPFLSEKKVIYVTNISSIDDKSDYYEDFLNAINTFNDTNIAIFLADSKLKSDSTIYKDLKKYAICYSFTNNGTSLDELLVEILKDNDFQMAKDAKDELLARIDNAKALISELDKLLMYKYDDKQITKNDVALLVSKNLDLNVFDLVTAVIEKNKKKAIEIYNDLQVANVSATYLLGLLLSKFQEIFDVKVLIQGGYSQDLIASIFKVKSGRAYYMIKNANMLNMKLVKQKLEELTKLEYDIKSGRQEQTLGLELFILK